MFHDFEDLIDILDPEKSRIPSFYIYDAYSVTLADLRKKKEKAKTQTESDNIWIKCIEVEDEIRKDLSKRLSKYCKELEYNLNQIANLDIVLAKAIIALDFGFCEPKISFEKTAYKQLFNPQLRQILESQNIKTVV